MGQKKESNPKFLDIAVPAGGVFTPPFTPMVRKAVHNLIDWYMDKYPKKQLHISMTPRKYRRVRVYED